MSGWCDQSCKTRMLKQVLGPHSKGVLIQGAGALPPPFYTECRRTCPQYKLGRSVEERAARLPAKPSKDTP